MLYLACFLSVIALYNLLAIPLKLPSFQAAKAFRKVEREKTGTFKIFVSDLAKFLSKYMPMGMLREIEMQKRIDAARLSITPKEYMAECVLHAVVPLILIIPAYYVHPVLALLPAVLSIVFYISKNDQLSKMGDKRRNEIEKELPRFVSYMANTLKSCRNVLDIIDVYRSDYTSALTEELAITAADIRTGNAERALQNLEVRINSPFMSELVRGMLSAMRGDDMTTYFENLSYDLSNVWGQRLRLQTLKKEPKIARMSYVVFIGALFTVIVVLIACVKAASSIFAFGMR